MDGAAPDKALVDDDGRTLWAAPTAGQPLDLAFMPAGVQIIVAMRPEALAAHPEGEKVLAALGPIGRNAMQYLDDALLDPSGVEHLILGLQATSDGTWQTAIRACLADGATAAEHLDARIPDAVEKIHNGKMYRLANGRAYFTPAGNDKLLIVAPVESIAEIIDLGNEQPPLRRDPREGASSGAAVAAGTDGGTPNPIRCNR